MRPVAQIVDPERFHTESKHEPEQAPESLHVILNCDMHVARRDADVAVASGFHDFRQRAAASKSMADECMAPVMDRKVSEPLRTKTTARRPEPFPQNVAPQRGAEATWLKRTDQRIVVLAAAFVPVGHPRRNVFERAAIPSPSRRRTTSENARKSGTPKKSDAFSDAFSTFPDLARVVAAWPTLPELIRRAMLALIS